MASNQNHPPVRTSALLGYLAAIYALLGTLGLLLLHYFVGELIPQWAQVVLFAVVAVLASVAWYRKRDFDELRWTSGQIELTPFQMVIVAAFVVALGGSTGLILLFAFDR